MIEIARELAVLNPTKIPLQSDHIRQHLVDRLENYGDLIPTERGTEKMNQELKEAMENVKRISGLDNRVKKMRSLLQIRKDAMEMPYQYRKNKKPRLELPEEKKNDD